MKTILIISIIAFAAFVWLVVIANKQINRNNDKNRK